MATREHHRKARANTLVPIPIEIDRLIQAWVLREQTLNLKRAHAFLAERCGCGRRTIEQVRSEPQPVNAAVLQLLATFFDVPLRQIALLPEGYLHCSPPIVGRADELSHLRAYWENPETRVVAVCGMGGEGKTALVARLSQLAGVGL